MEAEQLRHLSRMLVRELGMLDSECGNVLLTPVQAHALIELSIKPLTVNQLAALLKVDKSNASRTLAILVNKAWVIFHPNPEDKRSQIASLTFEGKEKVATLNSNLNAQVSSFMTQLDADEIQHLGVSLERYRKAIQASAQQKGYDVRLITPLDDASIAAVIRRVSAEYGLSADKGFSVADPTLDTLSSVYQQSGSAYWVVEHENRILGGGGIAPLTGEEHTCELQKMYFLPELRGKGLARRIAANALKYARQHGYKACYLETTANLTQAISLYHTLGFRKIPNAMGNTGHTDCEVRMLKQL